MDLLTIWILYAVIGVTLFSLLFVWAVRSGQFRDQHRARYLPLAGLQEEPPGERSAADKSEE
ncbi:MAG: cbb3-type cytochrome oxidase assembly protein CcoS [Armatimonadota bacterium]|jgi:cbb3-type cytochrome oxidase maturation protein